MISFHGDRLVGEELCRLLYQVVPREHHVPIIFHNNASSTGVPRHLRTRRSKPLGTYMQRPNGSAKIGIDLNVIIFAGEVGHAAHMARATSLWKTLLGTCLHEFGHRATSRAAEKLNQHEYGAARSSGRVYRLTEELANTWRDERFERILREDTRLGQPHALRGYLGYRLAREREYLRRWIDERGSRGSLRARDVKEGRIFLTGAQLAAGDMLAELGIAPYLYTNAYRVLRRASLEAGVGIRHVDAAGRVHLLYQWGDVPILVQHIKHEDLVARPTPEPEPFEFLGEDFVVGADDDFADIPF